MDTADRPGYPRGARWPWAGALAAALAAALLGPAGPATASAVQDGTPTTEDPGLDQTISAEEPVVTGAATIDAGHVDIGPRFVGEDWALLVHDASAEPAVWRSLDETVLQVHDTAARAVPDDPTYAFLGVVPGTEVYVVPQTQDPEVVWVGWNTQDPAVMERIDRGATLTLHGVQGPGELTMYLQSGNFGAPEVLWSAGDPGPQPLWVDVNTHTHANWVFTEPGVYLVQVEASADLVTGEQVSHTETLRFAVGDATSADEARGATFVEERGADDAGDVSEEDDSAGEVSAAGTDDAGGSGVVIATGIVTLALVLVAGVVAVVVRGGRVKARAERERTGGGRPAAPVVGGEP